MCRRGTSVMLAALAAMLAWPSLASAQLDQTTVGAWTVRSHFYDNAFRHCAMSAFHADARKLLIFAIGRTAFTLGVNDRSWNLRPDTDVSGYYQIDGGTRVVLDGKVMQPNLVLLRLRAERTVLEQFRTASRLRVHVAGVGEQDFTFALSGSAPAFDRLFECSRAGVAGARQPELHPGENRSQRPPPAALGENRAQRPPPPAAQPPSRPARPSAPKSAERKEGGIATGFYVTRAGHLVTANHVVRGCKGLTVQVLGEVPAVASVIAQSRSDDLALLKTSGRRRHVAPFAAASARLGEQVVVYGFPLQGMLTSSGNLTTGNLAALAGPKDDHRFLQFTAPVQPGNSGGPVLDLRGAVAGVVVFKLDAFWAASVLGDIPQNINFAVKSAVLLSFLEAHGIAVEESGAAADLSVAEVAERARAFTARIECQVQ